MSTTSTATSTTNTTTSTATSSSSSSYLITSSSRNNQISSSSNVFDAFNSTSSTSWPSSTISHSGPANQSSYDMNNQFSNSLQISSTSTEVRSMQSFQEVIERRKILPPCRIRLKENLNYQNWNEWYTLMGADLRFFELDHVVFDDFELNVQTTSSFKRMDEIAKDQIKINVDPDLRRVIENEPTSKRMFNKLDELVNGAGINKSIKLTMKLHQVIESSSSNLSEYSSKIQNVIREFMIAYPSIPEDYWTGVYVGFLPSKFNYLRSNLCLVRDLTLNKAIEAVLQEVQHVEKSSKTMSSCNNVKVKVENRNQNNMNTLNNNTKKSNENSKGNRHHNKFNKKTPKCDHCGGEHWLNKCELAKSILNKARNTQNDQQSPSSSSSANQSRMRNCNLRAKLRDVSIDNQSTSLHSSSIQDEEIESNPNNDSVCNAIMSSLNSEDMCSSKWYIDSGASRHMSNNVVSCELLNSYNFILAQTADGKDLNTQGVGNYVLKGSNGLVKFNDVVCCEELSASFISVGCLDRRGYVTQFGNGKCQVYDKNDELVFDGNLVDNNLYELNLCETQKVKLFNVAVRKPDQSSIVYWHNVLGHLNFNSLLKMKDKLGFEESDVSNLICTDCLLAKGTRQPFKSTGSTTPNEVLELIHSDLSGKIRISNQNQFTCYVTYTDGFTRFTTTYLLQSKSQTLDTFIEFQNQIENETGKRIQFLRTDGGSEYLNHAFHDHLRAKGIKKQTTCPSSPQQNAISERINRTLTDMIIAFLVSSGLPINLWPYALLHATRIKNMLPHSSINGEIPFEKLYGKRVDYSNEHRFGEQVIYVGLHKENKYTTRNAFGNFVGIPPGTKGYFIYVPSTGKVKIVHDVYFLNRMNTDRIQHNVDELTKLFDEQFNTESNNTEVDDVIDSNNQVLCSTSNENNTVDNIEEPSPDHDESYDTANSQIESLNLSNDLNDVDVSDLNEQDMPRGVVYLTSKQRREFIQRYPNADIQFVQPTFTGKRNPPCKYIVNSILLPKSFKQAMMSRERELWKQATDEEYLSHIHNKTWQLVDRPDNDKVLPCFWIFTTKTNEFGIINRYKARIVALGNLEEINSNDLDQFAAPVINNTSIKFLLALAVTHKYHVRHLDVRTAFLHAKLVKKVYMEQLPGYEIGGVNKVLLLLKSIYGLKVSALNWYNYLRELLISLGFKCSLVDNCIFYTNGLMVGVYVDDLLLLFKKLGLFEHFMKLIQSKLNIVDKGPISYCLSMHINYDFDAGIMRINQSNYIKEILDQFNLSNAKSAVSPIAPGFTIDTESESFDDVQLFQQLTGLLLYLANQTRLDISFAVNIMCRHMSKPTKQLFELGKRILRYLKGTINHKLIYTRGQSNLIIYTDADFGNLVNENKSITGCITQLGECTIGWSCRKQKQISTSTCESEVNAILEAVNEAQFFSELIEELKLDDVIKTPFLVFNDNQSSNISCISGGKFQSNRHYRLRLGRIREAIRDGLIKLKYCKSEEMKADLLTKSFTEQKLHQLIKLVNLSS